MASNQTQIQNNQEQNWTLLFVTWLIASLSMAGSLFFSEILKYPPCSLCWYQRITLFPLVLILLAGLFPLDPRVIRYSLPLTLVGWGISIYHNLLYTGIIPKSLQPCDEALSCTDIHLGLFGFITIPMLSFTSFTTLAILMIVFYKRTHNE